MVDQSAATISASVITGLFSAIVSPLVVNYIAERKAAKLRPQAPPERLAFLKGQWQGSFQQDVGGVPLETDARVVFTKTTPIE